MSDLTQQFLNLDTDLTADEIAMLTREAGAQWPPRLIEDYLTKFENLLRIVQSLDLNNDTTAFLVAQEGLEDTTSLQNARGVDRASEAAVSSANPRQPESIDTITQLIALRRMQQEFDSGQIQRRPESVEPVIPAQRQQVDITPQQAIPSRLPRLEIDDLTVESIISGNIAANVNATPANTAAQLQLSDKAGNVYYLPLYGAPW